MCFDEASHNYCITSKYIQVAICCANHCCLCVAVCAAASDRTSDAVCHISKVSKCAAAYRFQETVAVHLHGGQTQVQSISHMSHTSMLH
jgi:hypothetical protein